MKIYDCREIEAAYDAELAKDPYYSYKVGPWEDDINWKGLINEEGYTHVRVASGLYLMCKWGCGQKVEE